MVPNGYAAKSLAMASTRMSGLMHFRIFLGPRTCFNFFFFFMILLDVPIYYVFIRLQDHKIRKIKIKKINS